MTEKNNLDLKGKGLIILGERDGVPAHTIEQGYLHHMEVDTLLITGCTTGSCVRSTVLDASQNNFYPVIVEECVFDRSWIMHAFNLFEMDVKWADVVPVGGVKEYLRSLSAK